MNQIYSKKHFNIYRVANGYIVHNTEKSFKDGHTHLNGFESAKYVIDLALHKSIPYHLDKYRLISLTRITDDEVYANKIRELLENKRNKSAYNNCRKKCG